MACWTTSSGARHSASRPANGASSPTTGCSSCRGPATRTTRRSSCSPPGTSSHAPSPWSPTTSAGCGSAATDERTAGHAATCQMVRSRTGRSRPTSSSTRCSSCSTTGRQPGRGPSPRRIAATGATWSPTPGGHCHSTPSSASSPATRSPRTTRHRLPYLLSTQILLWYTAARLLAHASELRLDALALAHAADTVRLAIRDRFACPGPFGTQWAYETDGRGPVPALSGRQRPPDRPRAPVGTVPA